MEDKVRIQNLKSLLAFFGKFSRVVTMKSLPAHKVIIINFELQAIIDFSTRTCDFANAALQMTSEINYKKASSQNKEQ